MKVLFINAKDCKIETIETTDMHSTTTQTYIECLQHLVEGYIVQIGGNLWRCNACSDALFANEEARLNDFRYGFFYRSARDIWIPIFGNGVYTGSDPEGNSIDTAVTSEMVKDDIRFFAVIVPAEN